MDWNFLLVSQWTLLLVRTRDLVVINLSQNCSEKIVALFTLMKIVLKLQIMCVCVCVVLNFFKKVNFE